MPSNPPSIVLPTAAAFAALPTIERTTVFAQWLKTQPREQPYCFMNTRECPLARFGQALFSSEWATAGGWYITERTATGTWIRRINVVGDMSGFLAYAATYGEAADAFEAALIGLEARA